MIKKVLGIEEMKDEISKMKKEISEIAVNLKNAWDWFKLTEKRLEKNEKEIEEIKKMVFGIFERINHISVSLNLEEKVRPKIGTENLVIEILKQNNSFDENTAIPTTKVLSFLPFKMTERGLRKKLEKMHIDGLISSFKRKNMKYWYLKKHSNGTTT
ncbi:MAG: hypothetical protein QXP04_01245 [Candidatus Nanoarchaeia archaeon]|nr:hypothetical protein [Candidatus Jingweiarchaeum tengchongense]